VETFAMSDFDTFERRFAEALRTDADRSVRAFDPGSVARAAIAIDRSRRGLRNLRLAGYRRNSRRTWLLVAATLVIGASMLGAALAGGLRTLLTPRPTAPSVVTDVSPSPVPSQTTPSATLTAARPAQAGQFDDLCDFGLGSDSVGWVSTKSALYRTEDLGRTWSAVEPAGWLAATAVANLFIDADTAYSFLSSSPSHIAATHDGGATWIETAVGGDNAWPVFSFQTPSRGYLIFFGTLKTDPVSIYATIDGGSTWTGPQSATTTWAALMPEWCAHREPNGTLEQTHPWLDREPLNGLSQLSRDAGLTWTQRPVPAGGGRGPWGGGLWGDDSGRLALLAQPDSSPSRDEIYTSDDGG
jgi:hypothetical protein